jgi:hypothetical protein
MYLRRACILNLVTTILPVAEAVLSERLRAHGSLGQLHFLLVVDHLARPI